MEPDYKAWAVMMLIMFTFGLVIGMAVITAMTGGCS